MLEDRLKSKWKKVGGRACSGVILAHDIVMFDRFVFTLIVHFLNQTIDPLPQ